MNSYWKIVVLVLVAVMVQSSLAFSPATTQIQTTISSTSQLNLFGAAKDDGSPGDYVCKDCGYVFTKGPAAWAKLDDKYKCPPCGAPKFRFKKVPKGSASGKVDVKKSWF
uniref:Rubredoxin-like domain-containing protein n=1 Tax=Thalassionema nitzschioides TaxID=33649 RepID=A0A6T5XMQ8_9STRA|mmetsp:Transcript_20956/g.31044  ORF Transcript_20956/g.31044 Transcript_20956/m.31044 type:complete len:110 (+) Transcript_20956:54-383(+)|eukprot:CAMPEP_0194207100 /NCGR_PEP_ID=MMETSP0156-20130528/5954_1 /TAXON_ID=33649 /ORGANISM="Thalassionema nitzschioides, Strain L26-B" /LENGTH=109 /DNA_ID=CAMNT_0038933791 /DNA_START=50 /DNA_END=379 /DNA_ORIENTATION=-